MSTWEPDVCPDQNAPCSIITVGGAGGAFVVFERKCSFHAAKAGTDQDIYDTLVTNNKRREAARATIKEHLALPKDHPGVPYRTNPDGSYTLGAENASVMPEWPKDQAGLDKLNEAVDSALKARAL